jgi:hypothetical protein
MEEEINKSIDVFGLESLYREKYLRLLFDMNSSLSNGDYVKALDFWEDYDENNRFDLIIDLIGALDIQYTELERLQSVEKQLLETEEQLTIVNIKYNQLENTYNAISNAYRKVNIDLDIARRNLSTAITAAFLTAIVFYFLGRRSIKREETDRLVEPDIY